MLQNKKNVCICYAENLLRCNKPQFENKIEFEFILFFSDLAKNQGRRIGKTKRKSGLIYISFN